MPTNKLLKTGVVAVLVYALGFAVLALVLEIHR